MYFRTPGFLQTPTLSKQIRAFQNSKVNDSKY